MKRKFHNRLTYLPGNSLYLVVFISFILAVLLLLLISSNYYTQVDIVRYQYLKKLIDNTNNTINTLIVNNDFNVIKPEPVYSNNSLTTSEIDIMTSVFSEPWGGFIVTGALSEWKNTVYEKTALTGYYLFNKERTGLYLADQGKYLSIAGDTKLTGNCYLPALGIRSVYIDGKAYKGGELIYGSEKQSKAQLPELNNDLTSWILHAYKGNYDLRDTLLPLKSLKGEIIHQAFDKKAFVIEEQGILILNNTELRGKIIVRSDSMIIIRNECITDNIIVMAPKIIIESGFEGRLQIFARDSLLIEENVFLNYPSFVSVYNEGGGKSFCYIDKGSEIQGGVLCGGEAREGDDSGEIYISDEVTIHGMVYCNGSTKITGSVFGTLYTNRFVLKTNRGYYENHLLDAVIDPLEQYNYMLVPGILNSNQRGIIQWL